MESQSTAIINLTELKRVIKETRATESQKSLSPEQQERLLLKQMSNQAVKSWQNTTLGLRKIRLQALEEKKRKQEEFLQGEDRAWEAVQKEERKQAVEKAQQLQFFQTPRIRALHSQVLLSQIAKERDQQLQFKAEMKQRQEAIRDIFPEVESPFLSAHNIDLASRQSPATSSETCASYQQEQTKYKHEKEEQEKADRLRDEQELLDRLALEEKVLTMKREEKARKDRERLCQGIQEQLIEKQQIKKVIQKEKELLNQRVKLFQRVKKGLVEGVAAVHKNDAKFIESRNAFVKDIVGIENGKQNHKRLNAIESQMKRPYDIPDTMNKHTLDAAHRRKAQDIANAQYWALMKTEQKQNKEEEQTRDQEQLQVYFKTAVEEKKDRISEVLQQRKVAYDFAVSQRQQHQEKEKSHEQWVQYNEQCAAEIKQQMNHENKVYETYKKQLKLEFPTVVLHREDPTRIFPAK